MKDLLMRLWRDDSGQDLAEYAMLLVLIALVVIIALRPFGQAIQGGFEEATGQMFDGAGGGGEGT